LHTVGCNLFGKSVVIEWYFVATSPESLKMVWPSVNGYDHWTINRTGIPQKPTRRHLAARRAGDYMTTVNCRWQRLECAKITIPVNLAFVNGFSDTGLRWYFTTTDLMQGDRTVSETVLNKQHCNPCVTTALRMNTLTDNHDLPCLLFYQLSAICVHACVCVCSCGWCQRPFHVLLLCLLLLSFSSSCCFHLFSLSPSFSCPFHLFPHPLSRHSPVFFAVFFLSSSYSFSFQWELYDKFTTINL